MAKRILLVDDHAMFRWGVRQFIAGLTGFELAGEAGDGSTALELLARLDVDIILLDLAMPGLDGLSFLEVLKEQNKGKATPLPKLVILSQSANDRLCQKLQGDGIDGYVLKSEGIEEIGQALLAIERHESYFSPGIAKKLWDMLADKPHSPAEPAALLSDREKEVAQLVGQGFSNRVIAERLGCATNTVKTHRANAMRKAGVKNAAHLARWIAGLWTHEHP